MPHPGWHRNRAAETLTPIFPDADPVPLGQWGHTWWQAVREDLDYPVDGALVAEDGEVVGEVERVRGTYRVTDATRERYNLLLNVADRAATQIGHQIGQRVTMIKAEQVSPGRPLPAPVLVEIETLRDEIADKQALLELMAMEAYEQREETGVTVRQLTAALGYKTPQSLYDLLKRGS